MEDVVNFHESGQVQLIGHIPNLLDNGKQPIPFWKELACPFDQEVLPFQPNSITFFHLHYLLIVLLGL